MAALKSIKVKRNQNDEVLDFSYDVSVDKSGNFTTTLPKKIVDLFQKAGLEVFKNRAGNKGFISSDTMNGLVAEVDTAIEEYFSRKLMSEKIIIRYAIVTHCSYCLDKDGGIAPNGQNEWTGKEDYQWLEGTIQNGTHSSLPYGFNIFVEAVMKQEYIYKSKKKKTEYEHLGRSEKGEAALEKGYYLRWLSSLTNMGEAEDVETKEIEYTEEIAAFFVSTIKSICQINEKVKNMQDPKIIKKLAESKTKMIGN